jgi:hypothetical protein
VARVIGSVVTLGVFYGVSVGVFYSVIWRDTSVPMDMALYSGPFVGLVVGSSFGLGRVAWFPYIVSIARLALVRRFPWLFMRFMDDAHRLGLLRVAGSAYQFRHAALQDYLTSHP